MGYNRETGYPPSWVHLSYLKSALNNKLRGRIIDVEKIKACKCGWRWGQSAHGGPPHIAWVFTRNSIFKQHLVDMEKRIGLYAQGAYLNHGEITMHLDSKGCPLLSEAHVETQPRGVVGGDKYHYVRICAFPRDVCDEIVVDTEGCMGVDRGCSVGLMIVPGAHPMEPGEPPPYVPPPQKSYIKATSTPTNASIWLKKR